MSSGERFIIRTPSDDTNGTYSMVEVADHRSSTPMQVQKLRFACWRFSYPEGSMGCSERSQMAGISIVQFTVIPNTFKPQKNSPFTCPTRPWLTPRFSPIHPHPHPSLNHHAPPP